MRVDLVWIDSSGTGLQPTWTLGNVVHASASTVALAKAIDRLEPSADLVLFWDSGLGLPQEDVILSIAKSSGDVWHAGLSLGMGGATRVLDYVDPVWRFNRDSHPQEVATSWRLSLRACLARTKVLKRLGGPDPHFESLAGASLEMGHRWIRRGALMRQVAGLLPERSAGLPGTLELPLNDEIRFLRLRYGRMWTVWACWRMWRHQRGVTEILQAMRHPCPPGVATAPFLHELQRLPIVSMQVGANGRQHPPPLTDQSRSNPIQSVSVLIPTLDRYPYLFNLLEQLRSQTMPPQEIVVVDQTEARGRDQDWPAQFQDLPLRVLWREEAGQCSSRNAGLAVVTGETVLFLDDDDEVPPDLIEAHLDFLDRFHVDASCGVAEEVGAGSLPEEFKIIRESDVFPTNNTLLRTAALRKSGLFDLAYEKGERADGDLGMRLFLAGTHLVLNPAASVRHLHAPRGGLRRHDARVTTRASSRSSLTNRHLLAPTEAYLWRRYFSTEQVHEALLIRTFSTIRSDQSGFRRWLRVVYAAFLLPDTWRQNKSRLASGQSMLDNYPSIPDYQPATAEELVIV